MNKVVSVEPLPGFLLQLQFNDGLKKTVSLLPFIGTGASADLRDESYFWLVPLRAVAESSGPTATISALTTCMTRSLRSSLFWRSLLPHCNLRRGPKTDDENSIFVVCFWRT